MTVLQAAPAKGRRTAPSAALMDITVLAGGCGPEQAVSIESGKAVHQALLRLGHRAVLSDISPTDLSALDRKADFVFIALHGEFGEDGTVQAELDRRGIPYGGSGAAASHLAMDKVAAKRCFEQNDVPTPDYVLVVQESLRGLARRIGVPAVVKPVASGSSVDTFITRSPDALDRAAAEVVRKYGQALVERYIAGPELTVGVLGDQALPVCEIRTAREFYDYEAKYVDDRTQYVFDIELPASLLSRVRDLSLRAHQCLDCKAFSRVDWMIDRRTQQPYALEVNTIPGFTSHSLLPKAAARIGLSFDQLCQRIIELSLHEGGHR